MSGGATCNKSLPSTEHLRDTELAISTSSANSSISAGDDSGGYSHGLDGGDSSSQCMANDNGPTEASTLGLLSIPYFLISSLLSTLSSCLHSGANVLSSSSGSTTHDCCSDSTVSSGVFGGVRHVFSSSASLLSAFSSYMYDVVTGWALFLLRHHYRIVTGNNIDDDVVLDPSSFRYSIITNNVRPRDDNVKEHFLSPGTRYIMSLPSRVAEFATKMFCENVVSQVSCDTIFPLLENMLSKLFKDANSLMSANFGASIHHRLPPVFRYFTDFDAYAHHDELIAVKNALAIRRTADRDTITSWGIYSAISRGDDDGGNVVVVDPLSNERMKEYRSFADDDEFKKHSAAVNELVNTSSFYSTVGGCLISDCNFIMDKANFGSEREVALLVMAVLFAMSYYNSDYRGDTAAVINITDVNNISKLYAKFVKNSDALLRDLGPKVLSSSSSGTVARLVQ